MKIEDITPEMVIYAYETTGIMPIFGLTSAEIDGVQCACAIGVLAAKELGFAPNMWLALPQAIQVDVIMDDFIEAFDGVVGGQKLQTAQAELGRSVRQAVIDWMNEKHPDHIKLLRSKEYLD